MEIEENKMETGSEPDSSDDDSNEMEKRAEELETMLRDNKYLYDVHVELVGLYKKLADLTSMRLAYQRFYEAYPLTPELWMTWLADEIAIANTEEEHKSVRELFEKATEDYLSVKLWLQYAQYSLSTSKLEDTRLILEKAVNVAGLHVEQGSLLWDTLREFEMCQLPDPSTKEYQAQLQRIIDVFKRQLSVPLLFMDKTHAEWKEFEESLPEIEINKKAIEWAYSKALRSLDDYKPFEDKLVESTTNEEIWNVFKEYIKKAKDPSTAICLYERAIEKLCLVPEVWMEYLHFSSKLGDSSLKVSARALRNITWSEDLWVTRIRILEKLEQPECDVTKCFEDGMLSAGGLELWLSYLGYNRRKKSDKLMKLFEQAEDQMPREFDPLYKLTRLHAQIATKQGDTEKARSLWKKIMQDPTMKATPLYWIECIRLERKTGTLALIRALFHKALLCCKEWPQSISEEWLLFEHEEGSLDDLMKTSEIVKNALKLAKPHVIINNKPESRKRKSNEVDVKVEKKAKHDEPKESKSGVPKNQGPPSDLDPMKSVFVSNLNPFITLDHLTKFFPNGKVTLATNNKGESRCFGYVQFVTESDAEDALKRDREFLEKRPVFISKCKADKTERLSSFKYSSTIEDNKLFVRGLPVKYSTEDVEAVFKPHKCKSVRLVYHKSGQPKGLAYVEFENNEDAEKAVKATDQSTVGGFVISVAISAPPSKGKGTVAVERTEPNRNSRTRLQIPMVPRSVLKPKVEASGNGDVAVPKSNNDFRNMLLKK